MTTPAMRPFWGYYGSKYRIAPRYPAPRFGHIVEPFAGSAGYALRYPDLDVTLVDAYPVVAGIWRYLIGVSSAEVLRIPLVDSTDDLPAWVPQEARWLVGMTLNGGGADPKKTLSSGRRALRDAGRLTQGWSEKQRADTAHQVGRIRHWKILEGGYEAAPDVIADWFVDPPYNNKAGSYYRRKVADYVLLGEWCRARRGQVMVCENVGADWLPFVPFMDAKAGPGGSGVSREAIWLNEPAMSLFGEAA